MTITDIIRNNDLRRKTEVYEKKLIKTRVGLCSEVSDIRLDDDEMVKALRTICSQFIKIKPIVLIIILLLVKNQFDLTYSNHTPKIKLKNCSV